VVQLDGERRNSLVLIALEDQDPEVLQTAIEGLTPAVADRAGDRLKELLEKHGSESVREAAANALGKLKIESATEALMAALEDPGENVRWFAVEGLRKLDAEKAVPRLSELLLNDGSARVREITASTLGELGQPAAVPALRKALKAESERVRAKAASALQTLAGHNVDTMKIIARTLLEESFYKEAITVLRGLLEKLSGEQADQEEVISVHLMLGKALSAQQNYGEAISQYAKVEELSGGNLEAKRGLASARLQAGEFDNLADSVSGWLEAAEGDSLEPVVRLAIDTARKMSEENQLEQAKRVLNAAAERAKAEKEGELVDAVETALSELSTE
jgi:HEAT repeat protein